MSHILIAFSGKKGSGKSLARNLVAYNKLFESYTVYTHSFATPLKDAISTVFNIPLEYFNTDKKDMIYQQLSVSPRELMQKIGTEVFRNQLSTLFPNMILPYNSVWVYNMSVYIQEHFSDPNENVLIIIDDCRFENEYNMIKQFGGHVIRLERDDTCNNNSNSNIHTHESEQGCSCDYTIYNHSNNIAQFANYIDSYLKATLKL